MSTGSEYFSKTDISSTDMTLNIINHQGNQNNKHIKITNTNQSNNRYQFTGKDLDPWKD